MTMRLKQLFIFVLVTLAVASCYNRSTPAGSEQTGTADSTQVDSVLAELNRKILEDPANYIHYLNRAQYYGNKELYDQAFADIQRALAADSTRDDVYLYKGELHWFRQNVAGAYEEYKNCLKHNDKNTDCLLKKASIDIVLKNYDIAIKHINDALRQNEYLPYAYYLKGRLYRATGDTTNAFSSYQTAIERDPKYYDAYVEVGLLMAQQKHDLALEYYNQAIALKPQSIEAMYNKAMFLQETGFRDVTRYRNAFRIYDEILKLDPNWAAAHFNKGFIYLEYMQQYDSASVEFTNAITLLPEYTSAWYNRGLSYESLGKDKQAEADYRKALELKPDYTEAARALSRVLKE
ncbi:MAG: hypothetical protein RL220_2077 [Bacteroidota bacterium]